MGEFYPLEEIATREKAVLLDTSVLNSSVGESFKGSRLHEEVDHLDRIIPYIQSHEGVLSTQEVLEEHNSLIRGLSRGLIRIRGQSSHMSKKEEDLLGLLTKHRKLSKILKKRRYVNPEIEKLRKVSKTDAKLVCSAMTIEGPCGILTSDTDIVNIVRNLWLLHYGKKLPWNTDLVLPAEIESRLSRNSIKVYFIERENPNSKGYGRFLWGI